MRQLSLLIVVLHASRAIAHPGCLKDMSADAAARCPFARKLSETDPATFTTLNNALLDGTSVAATPGAFESGTRYPHDIMTCPGGAVLTTPSAEA